MTNIMQPSSSFIRLAEPVPKVKKSALINGYENIIAYWKESKQNQVQANIYGLLQIHLKGLKVGVTPGNCGIFTLI